MLYMAIFVNVNVPEVKYSTYSTVVINFCSLRKGSNANYANINIYLVPTAHQPSSVKVPKKTLFIISLFCVMQYTLAQAGAGSVAQSPRSTLSVDG